MSAKCPKCGAKVDVDLDRENPQAQWECGSFPFIGTEEGFEETIYQADKCRIRELETALLKLWKHTPKIDNGHCAVCRIGYADWLPDGKGGLKVGPCDRADCLSHVVTAALAKEGT